MDQKYRLMCESWVEKRPEVSQVTEYGTASRKQSIKWKTRYAMLVVSCETRSSELKFYQKKPRSCTEITDDVIRLKPWQYIVDIPSWIVDKGRSHVLRLRLLPESIVPGQHFRLQIAYQSAEEATAWMRCIQNQTKLTSGIQGHSFGLVAEECSATARIGVAGKHCLLFVSPEKVILAHKTDRSVVCVWPFETIRSYASDDDRRLVIEAGRCAPLGDGVYSFRTRENDDNVIFDLFDHYTSQPMDEVKTLKNKVKRNKSNATLSDQTISSPVTVHPSASSSGKSRSKVKQTPSPRSEPEVIPLLTTWSDNSTPEYGAVPPEKPFLPENRKILPFALTKSTSELRDKHSIAHPQSGRPVSYAEIVETAISRRKGENGENNRSSVLQGCDDLDLILQSLEGPNSPKIDNSVSEACYDQPATSEVLEKRMSEIVDIPNTNLTAKLELAYEVNTLKSDILLDDLEQYHMSEENTTSDRQDLIPEKTKSSLSEQKMQKPKVAPKPPSVKIPKSVIHSFSTKSSEPLPDKPFPPYAKIDQDKKRKSGIA
ncbi:uncharacterized protein LOC120326374 isoform X1 [Styela clava]